MSAPRACLAVAYYRLSNSGFSLPLDVQQKAVRDWLDSVPWQLIAEITEIEGGRRSNRPKLAEALKLCKCCGAQLIVAKPGRRAYNVAFVSALLESGVDFIAVDVPHTNRLPIHMQAAHAALRAKADQRASDLAVVLDQLRAAGITSANAMAGALNVRGIATTRNSTWTARGVLNVMKRLQPAGVSAGDPRDSTAVKA